MYKFIYPLRMVFSLKKLSKLLENLHATSILQLLVKNPCTISQIMRTLQTDAETTIAVLGELHHFGLIERVEKTSIDMTTMNQEEKITRNIDFLSEPRLGIPPTPLGIPLKDYSSLWEKIRDNSNQFDPSEFDTLIFSVPVYLRKELEESTVEEIRRRILE
ncbi:MAG: hypothetical protein JSV04_11550 [Candidatus Heimdallarchaeota archaeon]|nr:MAG: hypothetical protein JSV04_11550 [Candidatus Heimdallarchaeota archaeon]